MTYLRFNICCLVVFAATAAAAPVAKADTRPNILLLFPDEWRFDWADQLYVQNLSIHTPTFASIAKNGTRFSHACVGAPLCAPSRSCIAAGKEYDYTGVPTNGYDFPATETTIYQLMRANGYWIMVSGKDDLTKPSGCGINGTYRQTELGFDDQRRCKGKEDNTHPYPTPTDPFAVYLSEHYHANAQGVNVTEWNITDDCNKHCCNNHACPEWMHVTDAGYEDIWITDRTLEMLDQKPSDVPWFLQINWAGPHPPFIITESMNKSVNNRSYPYPIECTLNANDMQVTRRDYTAEIENLDTQFARIIAKVRELDDYDNTVICVSSDHGEMLGDYNTWAKSKPWVASSNVPLVCMGPDIQRNVVLDTYVTNMDLAGTFLDYSQTAYAPELNITSQSLRPFLNGTWNDNYKDDKDMGLFGAGVGGDRSSNGYREYVSSGLNNWRMVVQQLNSTVTWKYVCCQSQCPARSFVVVDGLVQLLFNIKADLYEEHNIIDAHAGVAQRMKEWMPPNFCVPGNYTGKWDRFLRKNDE